MFNRYTPRALLSAMSIDIDDLHSKMADFRMYINQYAYKLNSIAFPNSLSYMARHAWMNDGIYLDGSTSKAQMYLYVQDTFYQLATEEVGETPVQVFKLRNAVFGTSVPNGGTSRANLRKLEDIITFGDSLLKPLLTIQSVNIMSGDIEKAFGESGLYKVPGITDDYAITPEYNMEVLSQMENLTLLGISDPGRVSTDVHQTVAIGTGYLTSTPTLINVSGDGYSVIPTDMEDDPTLTADRFKFGQFLNFHIQPVIPPNVLVATRGMCAAHSTGFQLNNGNIVESIAVDSCGSEIFSYMELVVNESYSTAGDVLITVSFPVASCGRRFSKTYTASSESDYLWTVQSLLSTYDWHPDIRLSEFNVTNQKLVGSRLPNLDLDNYTILTPGNIQNLHSTALLAELTVSGGLQG